MNAATNIKRPKMERKKHRYARKNRIGLIVLRIKAKPLSTIIPILESSLTSMKTSLRE